MNSLNYERQIIMNLMKKLSYSLFVLLSFSNTSNATEEFWNAERQAKHVHYWEALRVNPNTFTVPMQEISASLQIGVADTGFNVYHPLISPNVARGINGRDGSTYVAPSVVYDPTRPDFRRITTHGTDVAGICAAMNPVVIVPGKLGACGHRPLYALNEVLKTFAGVKEIQVVNISGFDWYISFEAIFNLARSGKTVVVSAGNDNKIMTDLILSNGKTLSEILHSLNGRVFFVGATEKKSGGIEQRASYSNWPHPTLAPFLISAPGTVDTISGKKSQGTSYAAPVFVSAMVRLSLEFNITIDAARTVLFRTTIKRTNEHFNVENTGVGIINFMEAWNELKRSKALEAPILKQDMIDTYSEFAYRRQEAEKRIFEAEQQIKNIEIYVSQQVPFNIDAKIVELQTKAFQNGKSAVQERLSPLKESELSDKDALMPELKDIWKDQERCAAFELLEHIEACRQKNNLLLLAATDKISLLKNVCTLRMEASHYSHQEFLASLKLDHEFYRSKSQDALTARDNHFEMSKLARNWERYESDRASALQRQAVYLNRMLHDRAFIRASISNMDAKSRDKEIAELILKARFQKLINEKVPNPEKPKVTIFGV
jgi:hypothetical protein